MKDGAMNKKIPIDAIKKNPNNPRIIKDDKFKKLVESVKAFPEMLDIRPIVVNADMVVLGGNMRLAACKAAGLKEVPIIDASHLTEEQQREFIIKDNVSGGEWDWEMLGNEWDISQLDAWGLDTVQDTFGDTSTDRDGQGVSSTWEQVDKSEFSPVKIGTIETKITNELFTQLENLLTYLSENGTPVYSAIESVIKYGVDYVENSGN